MEPFKVVRKKKKKKTTTKRWKKLSGILNYKDLVKEDAYFSVLCFLEIEKSFFFVVVDASDIENIQEKKWIFLLTLFMQHIWQANLIAGMNF